MGGSISAEHGLGSMKTEEARRYKSPVEVAALSAIRQSLDPQRIMNPRVFFRAAMLIVLSPAKAMNFSMIPELSSCPPPTMTRVPLAGPYSGTD